MYEVVRVTATPYALEQQGIKQKYWFTDESGEQTLFKAEARGYGEDWSEKVACELAELLGIPHVHYEMAYDANLEVPGVLCRTMLTQGQTLIHGNALLHVFDRSYPKTAMRDSAYTVDAVHRVVRRLPVPEARWTKHMPREITTGDGVFSGYLMLDAWVANQDRHHQNWATIWDGKNLRLAPSYDHASGLARTVSEEERAARLATKDRGYSVAAFARKARSRFFRNHSDDRPLGSLEAFHEFTKRTHGSAAEVWRDRLRAVDESAIAAVLAQVPPNRLTAVSREFTLQLLMENRTRILGSHEEAER